MGDRSVPELKVAPRISAADRLPHEPGWQSKPCCLGPAEIPRDHVEIGHVAWWRSTWRQGASRTYGTGAGVWWRDDRPVSS